MDDLVRYYNSPAELRTGNRTKLDRRFLKAYSSGFQIKNVIFREPHPRGSKKHRYNVKRARAKFWIVFLLFVVCSVNFFSKPTIFFIGPARGSFVSERVSKKNPVCPVGVER